MKLLILPAFPLLLASSAWATSSITESFVVNSAVPDNNPIGFSDTRQITTSITQISKVTVQISMTGGWAGDMYAYLSHGSGFAVLLNRPGRTLQEVAGSGVSGISVEFDDDAVTDIHTAIPYTGTVPSGFFQPDARVADPDDSLDTSTRSAFLNSFLGQDANGDWTLYVADVATGDQMVLQSWSLTVQGVPEPGTSAVLVFSGALLLFRRRRSAV